MNVDSMNIFTKAHVTVASDQAGRIYIGREELKAQRIWHNAMVEQDAAHIGCEADLVALVLDVQGRQLSAKGLLDTGAVGSGNYSNFHMPNYLTRKQWFGPYNLQLTLIWKSQNYSGTKSV